MSAPETPRAPGSVPAGPGGQPGDAAAHLPPPGAPAGTPPGPPPAATGQAGLIGLRKELEADIARIASENDEIDVLMEQVLAEIDRHEGRRSKIETQLAALETGGSPDPDDLTELRDALLALTRREMLFDAQRQVLEGKKRVLSRFQQRMAEVDGSLAALSGGKSRPAPMASPGLRALADTSGGPFADQPAMAIRSQEELRRDIVRQLHDGPAQSIANIGLQAEIVERLIRKADPRAVEEIESLRRLVQAALDTTKEFIFEIRPMVLDDLGLAPTIRRAAGDRGRRAGISVDFDSQGTEQRLDSDLESAVYRSVDEAIEGFLELRPPSVMVRLDWGERELVVTVAGSWPQVEAEGPEAAALAGGSHSAETPPALLAMMEEKRSADREADRVARSLSRERVQVIDERARALGLGLTMHGNGQAMELAAPIRR